MATKYLTSSLRRLILDNNAALSTKGWEVTVRQSTVRKPRGVITDAQCIFSFSFSPEPQSMGGDTHIQSGSSHLYSGNPLTDMAKGLSPR